MILIALVSGVLGVIISLALRRDTPRARQIRQGGGLVDTQFVLLSLPGFSLILLAAGIFGLIAPGIGGWLGGASYPVAGALALLALAGVVLSVMGMTNQPVPAFMAPPWYNRK